MLHKSYDANGESNSNLLLVLSRLFMFISPQLIIFMVFVYNCLKKESKELKKYENFPVGSL